jgi:hypothetical protein
MRLKRLISVLCGWNAVEIISAIFQPLQPHFNRARKFLTHTLAVSIVFMQSVSFIGLVCIHRRLLENCNHILLTAHQLQRLHVGKIPTQSSSIRENFGKVI